ncbi:hypothetical protein EUZ85_14890 [Hahella sp. KA22]|uniref:hypothetical protein n=1 Tax=Hahella sp. KA22 TaxID=1628392 RepID=UPI000FDE91BA|nr:hypothetical protein [Hahella sp. KA22]AZZ91946.1 hypothetical protein ENC22_12325 [Hahella sp. KA22]QAY55317.1 hypothetical protein EUZ85_14890 [Hahella sp. KA22]
MRYAFAFLLGAILAVALSAFAGCITFWRVASDENALFSIPVLSSENIDISDLNKRISTQAENDILAVLSLIGGPIYERGAVSVRSNKKDFEKEYSVVLINDNIPDDDSVSGYRYDIVLKRDKSDNWVLVEMTQSWRCWEDRGHTQFGVEPCM